MSRLVRAIVAAVAVIAGCAGAEHRAARDRYNEGVAALAKKDFDGAEKALLAARDQARVDPELRYRAAFNLGLALAAHADQLRAAQPPDPQGALDRLRQAAGWFRDAIRLRDRDPEAAAALDNVLARARALADELARGENGLEPRLDRLIDDERGLRDAIEQVWLELEHGGAAGADPLAGGKKLTELADRERVILTEAGVVGDLAADEIDSIGKKPDDERTDEQKVRVVQLQNLDLYLQEARAGLGNARRKLQELTPGPAHASAENALASLKRAREQLLDPIAALSGIAGDQVSLYQETDYLQRAHVAEHSLDLKEPPPVVPAWLTTDDLAMRQGTLRDRVDEVRARLETGVAGAEKAAAGGAGAPGADPNGPTPQTGLIPDPGAPTGTGTGTGTAPATGLGPAQDPKAAEQARVLALIKAALPSVTEAVAAMERARSALAAGKVDDGVRAEADALVALARAIERFADLKKTIDLAWMEQEHVIQMLDPVAAKDTKPAERARTVKDGTAKNLERIARIGELIGEARAELDARAAAAAAPAGAPGAGSAGQPAPDPKADEAKAQLAAEQERLVRAEELRGKAATALAAVAAALARGKDPGPAAREAGARLGELRELFFSVIEHLQQLIRDQGETRDRTARASSLDELARAPVMPDLVTRETDHTALGQAIQDALAKQADAAGQAGGQGPQAAQAAEAAKNLTAAVEEVRLGVGEMSGARDQLGKAKDATNASYDLAPTLDGQAKAIEHLKNALRLLQPPQQDQQDQHQQQQQQQQQQGQDDKDQQQQQQQQGKDDKDQDPSGALQRVRDDEARRQRERREREREREQPEPVDKDW